VPLSIYIQMNMRKKTVFMQLGIDCPDIGFVLPEVEIAVLHRSLPHQIQLFMQRLGALS
jgi:hypothetical protein